LESVATNDAKNPNNHSVTLATQQQSLFSVDYDAANAGDAKNSSFMGMGFTVTDEELPEEFL